MQWSQRAREKKRDYVVFCGRAYPRVLEGENPTKHVTSDLSDRESYYRDPAIALSEADLDKFNGAEGKPLWVEHGQHPDFGKTAVGEVYHSYLANGGGLKIWGRIYNGENNPLGQQAAAMVKNGELKGLSVGYGASIRDCVSGTSVTKKLESKSFREISLCREPFFAGCNISVAASKKKNSDYNSTEQKETLGQKFIGRIHIMATEQTSETQPEKMDIEQTPAAASEAGELLKEGNKLKETLNQQREVAEKQNSELEQMRQRLAEYEAVEAKRQEEYKAANMERANTYIAALEKSNGAPLADGLKQNMIATFTTDNPNMRAAANALWKQHQQTVAVAASLDAKAKELEQIQKDKNALQKAVGTVRTVMTEASNTPRKAIAESVQPEKELEQKEVNASKPPVEDDRFVYIPKASAAELPWMQPYNDSGDIQVNASGGRRALAKPPLPNMTVLEGEDRVPFASARIRNPAFFAWMTDPKLGLAKRDLSTVARINASMDEITEKKAPSYKEKVSKAK